MAIACPVDLNTAALRSEISGVYGRVAEEPGGEFHFHRGPAYAAEFLGYDSDGLAALPPDCTASSAGIGNPLDGIGTSRARLDGGPAWVPPRWMPLPQGLAPTATMTDPQRAAAWTPSHTT
jgi:hypothetical protein